jgi:hypothetical protein
MSYCRFTEGDVYAYECEGGVQFYVARNVARKYDTDLDRLCNTFSEAYEYAKALRDEHGLDVPDYAIAELEADAIDEARRMIPLGLVETIVDLWNDIGDPQSQSIYAERLREFGIEVGG